MAKQIKCNGLPTQNYEHDIMLFINSNLGFISGSEYTDEAILKVTVNTQQDAEIYKTEDGGKHWKKVILGKGSFVDLDYSSGVLFAVKNIYSDEYFGYIKFSIIYTSKDDGKTWQELKEVPLFVRDIHFFDSLNGIIIARDHIKHQNFWSILKTNDAGMTWKEIGKIDDLDKIVKGYDFLYYLHQNKTMLNIIDQKGQSIKQIKFDEKRKIDDLCIYRDNVWVVETDTITNKISIIEKVDKKEEIIKEFILEKDNFPDALYVYEKYIYLMIGKMTTSHVEYRFIVSEDGGKSWKEELLPINDVAHPMAAYRNTIFLYSGGGYITKLN